MQETLIKFDGKYLILGIGIYLVKSPYIKNYPTTRLSELFDKKVSTNKIRDEIKKIFETKFTKLYG